MKLQGLWIDVTAVKITAQAHFTPLESQVF